MPTVTAFIRTIKSKGKVRIRFRLTDGRAVQLFHISEQEIEPSIWDSQRQCVKSKIVFSEFERNRINSFVSARKKLISDIYLNRSYNKVSNEWLNSEIGKALWSERRIVSVVGLFDQFLDEREMSEGRKKQYKVVQRSLVRFEEYTGTKLLIDDVNADSMRSIDTFLSDEYAISSAKRRGKNTRIDKLKKLMAVLNWAHEKGLSMNLEYKKYNLGTTVYGSPYYLTIEERDAIYNTSMPTPELANQRDIFIFQCHTGCRVSDLYGFTKKNIVDGQLVYIARKTKEGNPVTIRVPLTSTAKEILRKHKKDSEERLFKYINKQDYNEHIREVLRICGINRNIVRLNPTTREPETVRICDAASSHMARRTFIGNLYKKVKDQNLISSMTGHGVNSKAFARYREIDDDIKTQTIKLIE
ncbi:MAG: recombinase [Bacteroidales bacterium]|jgi:integrase|nr:recombinase [Bacteroidales bacterium]